MNVEAIHRPRDRRVPFNPFAPEYPGEGCKGGPVCAVCPRWRCPGCMFLRPWCFGCGDERPHLCDDCAMTATPAQDHTRAKERETSE